MLRSISSSSRLSTLLSYSVRAQSTVGPASLDQSNELKEAKPFKDVPKMLSLPLFGTMGYYLPIIGKYNIRKFHEASKMKHREYGDIVREDLTPFNKLVHLFNPDDFEKVFRMDGKFPARQTFKSIYSVVKNETEYFSHPGLLNSNGEEWWSLRSKVQPHMLKPRTTVNYLPAIDAVASEFVERMRYLRDPKSLEIKDYYNELIRFALEAVGYVALDAKLGCLSRTISLDSDTKIVLESAGKLIDMLFVLELNSVLWRYFETPLYKKFKRTFHEFTKICLYLDLGGVTMFILQQTFFNFHQEFSPSRS